MENNSRYKKARNLLLVICLFVGIGAVFGSVCMLIKPDGSILEMQDLLPYFQVLPFADVLFLDYTFSGISLLIVNGLTNITAAVLLIMNKKAGTILGCIFGITLMLWICIQFYMFPPFAIDVVYFIIGLVQAITGYAAWVFYKQENFKFNVADYPNIGKNHDNLVIYFSRMGYTKKVAYEKAEKTGADILEIKAREKTDGTGGFWWCGRFGLHGWDMQVKESHKDLEEYKHITICTPIWVFKLASPVRAFLRQQRGEIKSADYVLVHYQRSRYTNASDEMDKLLGLSGSRVESICSRHGKYKII